MGLVPKYTEQLVALVTVEDRTTIERLELVMKRRGDAVSRADVIRQGLAKGLPSLVRKYQRDLDALPEGDKALVS